MNKILVILVFLTLCGSTAWATDNLRLPDARSLSMGCNAGAHSAFFNPSLLGIQTMRSLRVDYLSPYSVAELATVSAGFYNPNRLLPFGLNVASFGFDEYRESMFRISAGKQLNALWAAGIGVQYALLQSVAFESDAACISTDIGMVYKPIETVLISLSVVNFPSRILHSEGVSDKRRITPFLAELNANWDVLETVMITGGFAHSKETPLLASVGMEYYLMDDFCFRMGVRIPTDKMSLGVGYHLLSCVLVDATAVYHHILGVSMGLGLSYFY